MLPHLPYENPCWHYRRTFNLKKKKGERYYINFEGVDSAFYLYINGEFKGYSQISHATSEFDITELAVNGENTIDVLVPYGEGKQLISQMCGSKAATDISYCDSLTPVFVA